MIAQQCQIKYVASDDRIMKPEYYAEMTDVRLFIIKEFKKGAFSLKRHKTLLGKLRV